MGGVRSIGVVVECDRCKKIGSVEDEAQAEFYKRFAARWDREERMFVSMLNAPDGSQIDIDFEYLCPKCVKAVMTYVTKIKSSNNDKNDSKSKGGRKSTEKEPSQAQPSKVVAEESSKEEPSSSEAPGEPFEDDELFD